MVANNLSDVFCDIFIFIIITLLPSGCHLRVFFLFIINTVLLSQFINIFVVSLLEIVTLKETSDSEHCLPRY